MGSGFYSFDEAATRLCKSKRSLYAYVKKGILKKRMENGISVLDREDVDVLAVDIGAGLPPINRKTMSHIQSRVAKVEQEMWAVKHALGLRDSPPLRPDVNGCLGIMSACSTYLGIEDRAKHWTPEMADKWAGLFELMDEETFSSFAKASNNQQAWIPFFKFCSELMDFCWEKDRQVPSLVWQAKAGRLDTARQRLRGVIVTMIELGRGTVPPQFLEALGSHREALVAQMAKEGQA